MRPILPLPLLLLALCACGDKDDTAGFDATTFVGGTFQFTTTGVDDACYDGSFGPIFMPDGAAKDWDVTTELPGWAELPASYDLALPEPFVPMAVTVVDGGAGLLSLAPTDQPDAVVLDPDNFPECMVQIKIGAELTIVDADSVQGSATLETEGFEADPDHCPVVQSDPCTITLDLTATRVN